MPTWLDTDEVRSREPPRPRKGWAPRPQGKVKLMAGWNVPEVGAGQGPPSTSFPMPNIAPRLSPLPTSLPSSPQRASQVQQRPSPMAQAFAPTTNAPLAPAPQSNVPAWQPFTPADSSAGGMLTNAFTPATISGGTPSTSQNAAPLSRLPVGVQRRGPAAPASAPARVPPQGGRAPTGGATQPSGDIDSTNPSSFAQSFAPYAQYAAAQLGIDPVWVTAMASSESNYGKAQGNELFGVKALPGQPGTTMATHEGQWGGTAQNATFAAYDSPQASVDAWISLIKNHYPGAVGAPDLASFVHGLKAGGYFTAAEPEYLGIVQSIANRVGGDVTSALANRQAPDQAQASAPGQGVAINSPDLAQHAAAARTSQFQMGLSTGDAYAFCGPAAAMAFAQTYGRNPTAAEAMDLAKKVGWTQQKGMAGAQSEVNLLQRMGIDAHFVAGDVDWNLVSQQATSGNPVILDTPGHYFYIDGFDPQTGRFHTGTSGTDLRQGAEWMTSQQIGNTNMGMVRGAIYADHPLSAQDTGVGAGNEGEGPTKTKREAAYTATAERDNCRDCSMFRKPNDCTLVQGYIHPGGTCKHFDPKRMGAGQGPLDFFQPEAQAIGQDASALGTTAQNILGAVRSVPQTVQSTAQNVVQGAQQLPAAAVQKAKEIPPAVSQAAQQVPGAIGGAASALGTEARAVQQHPMEETFGRLPMPDVPPLSPQDQAALRHEAPPRRTMTDIQEHGPSPPLSPIASVAIGQPHGAAAGGIRPGDLGSLARATLLDPVVGELPLVEQVRQLAGINDPFTGWRQQLRQGEQRAVVPEFIRDKPVLGGITEQMFDPTFPMLAFGGGPMSGVFDAAWGLDPVASMAQRGVFSAGGRGFGLLRATSVGRAIGGSRLVSALTPGPLLGRTAMTVVNAMRLPGNLMASGAYQAATRGLTRGLDQNILSLVGHRLDQALPVYQTGKILSDLAKRTGSAQLAVDAARAAAEGEGLERVTGQQLREWALKHASPQDLDAVLQGHGMDALTTRYVDAHKAATSAAARILPEVARNATNLPLGAVGGHVMASVWPAGPDDNNRDQKILFGTAAGMAVMGGNPYATAWMEKTVLPAAMRQWRSLNNPMANLKDDVAPILQAWVSRRNTINQVDRPNLLELIRDNWGGDKNAERVSKELEKNATLPADLWSSGGLQAVNIIDASNQEILSRGITKGADATLKAPTLDPALYPDAAYQAKFYLTHATKKEWVEARKAASVGRTPQALWAEQAGIDSGSIGIGSRFNTISHMTQQREWANFAEGEKKGVQYEYNGLDHRTADQYANQQHVINNHNMAAQLEGMIQDFDKIPPGKDPLDYSILHIKPGAFVPQGFSPAARLGIGQILNGPDIYINDALKVVLNRAFKEEGLETIPGIGPILKKAAEINSYGKESVLSASAFHLLNVTNQFLAANGLAAGLGHLPMIMTNSLFRRGFQQFAAANEPEIRKAVEQNMTWNTVAQVRTWNWGRTIVTGASTAGAYWTGYNASKAVGASDDDAHAAGITAGLLATGLNFPIGMLKGSGQREWSSIATHFSDMLFHRTIPMMKLLTWQMHGMTPEAARFVNDAFGGENIQAMLRSRKMTDILRLGILAPDWTGGFVRQIGSALLDKGSVGSMNRAFWTSAAMNAVLMVEGLNFALAGHGSWKNTPGNQGTVDLTPFFDQHGWKHVNPSTGEDHPVYMDIVPAWRGLLEPFQESARWGLAALAQTDVGQRSLLNQPAVVGGMAPGQPAPPSALSVSDAWGKYASGRVGLVPGAIGDLLATTDYSGRPVNQDDDPIWARMGNALQRQAVRLTPASVSSYATASARGVPAPVAIAVGATGYRLRTPTPYAEAQQKRSQVIEEFTGKTQAQYQQAYSQFIAQKNDAYDKLDRIHAGQNPDSGAADPNLTTPAQRLSAASKVHRPTLPEFEKSLMTPQMQEKHPELLQQYMEDLKQLDSIKGQASGQDPADFTPDSYGLDGNALYNEVWNRQPTDLANARDKAAQSRLRRQWLTDAALQHGIDHSDLEDFVKARLMHVDLAQYQLPGMNSQDLDLITNAWQQAGSQAPDDPVSARQLQQEVIGRYASAYHVEPQKLQERVHLRTVAPAEQTPGTQQYDSAVGVLEAAHDMNSAPQFANPDGTPYQGSGPSQWAQWNQQLSAADKWDKYKGIYLDKNLEALAQAKARGAAKSAEVAWKSPGYWNYERWFGLGKYMTDAQWSAFRAGTLDMWADKPTPKEAQNRNNLIALYKTLNQPDPKNPHRTLAMNVGVTITLYGRVNQGMRLDAAVKWLNKEKSNAWKANPDPTKNALGLPSNITDASAPPAADLSQAP